MILRQAQDERPGGAGRDCHVAALLAVSVLFVKGGSGCGLELGGPRGTSAGYGVQLQQQLPHDCHQGHFAQLCSADAVAGKSLPTPGCCGLRPCWPSRAPVVLDGVRHGWIGSRAFDRCPETRGRRHTGRPMPFRHTGPTRATRRPGRLRSGHPHRARCDRPQPVGETPRSAPGVPGEVPGTDHPAFRSPGPTRRCVFVRNPGRVDCERGTNGSSPGCAGRPTAPDGAGGPATGLGRPPGPGWEQVGRPAIPREQHGVQTVGLGLITTGPSKGPDLVGMGNMHRHSNLAQRLRHQCFITASGFTNRQQGP